MRHRDNRKFAVQRYDDILAAICEDLLSGTDRKAIRENRDWQTLQAEIHYKRVDPQLSPTGKRVLNQLQPLPRTLNDFVVYFQNAVHPETPDMNPLWGLAFLTLKVNLLRMPF